MSVHFEALRTATRREFERQLQGGHARFDFDALLRVVLTGLEQQGYITPLEEQRTGKGPTEQARVGDIVQVIDTKHPFHRGLVIVDQVSNWGVRGYTPGPEGDAFTRLEWSQFMHTGSMAPTVTT